MADPSDEEKARIERARAEYEAATRGRFVEESACGAVYRVIGEGGPARGCVLPADHDGDHQDVRALRARVAELEAERDRERQSVPYTLGAEAMRARAAEAIAALHPETDEDALGGYDTCTVVEELERVVRALPLTDDDARGRRQR